VGLERLAASGRVDALSWDVCTVLLVLEQMGVSMETLLVLGVLAALAYWIYKAGKRTEHK
jgi:hypothetical protein